MVIDIKIVNKGYIRSCKGANNMSGSNISWTSQYSALADALLQFKEDRAPLVEIVKAAYLKAGLQRPKLDDGEFTDIDPFSVFGLFNRRMKVETQDKLLAALASELGLSFTALPVYDDIPGLLPLNAVFYGFGVDRNPEDIDNLWKLFVAALDFADFESEYAAERFITIYDQVLKQKRVKWNLTIGLFWIRPFTFLSLDSKTRWFLNRDALLLDNALDNALNIKTDNVPSGATYLQICSWLKERTQNKKLPFTNIPDLVCQALNEASRVNALEAQQNNTAGALGDSDVRATRYWLYAPGADAQNWEEFFNSGVMAIGWPELGDLGAYANKEEMRLTLATLSNGASTHSNSALAAWQFTHDIQVGDVVFAKRGTSEILGVGTVIGEYTYNSDAVDFPHLREVDWSSSGESAFSAGSAT